MNLKISLSKLFNLLLTCLLLGQITVQYAVVRSRREGRYSILAQRASTSEKRYALVIGNSAYQHTDHLRNTKNDATDIAKVLRELGFEVLSGVDQNKKQMETLIRQFGDKLVRNGGTGLFYYSGHGLRVKGENYLVPVDADIPEEDEVAFAAVSVSLLMAKLNTAKNDFNIVILDACRNNPFARSWRSFRGVGEHSGLASMRPPSGVMILYAAQPGGAASDGDGKNGLFTEALLKHIKQPNLEYEQLTRVVSLDVYTSSKKEQLPYKEGTQLVDFYFVPAQTSATASQAAKPSSSSSVNSDENPGCGKLSFDANVGKMNGIAPTASPIEVKRAFPCFTGETPEGENQSNNGGGIFFINHDFYFYTYEDHIEVRSRFTGSVTHSLLGKETKKVTEAFGKPTLIDNFSPATGDDRYYYRMSYGCLVIDMSKGKVEMIGAFYKTCTQARRRG